MMGLGRCSNLFEHFAALDHVPDSEDRHLANLLQSAWQNLAETADPGFAAYQPDSLYEILDLPLRRASDAVHTRCDFWDALRLE